MRKQTGFIVAVAIVLDIFLTISLATARNVARNDAIQAYRAMQTAIGERDNAIELVNQYKQQYNEAVFEIAELKGKNEKLTRAFEEMSFALDEVCFETGWTDLGYFNITFYCECDSCCGKYANGITATGTTATEGRTVAVDPSIIPLGSKVKIDGHVYTAEDTGVHGKVIDVFVDRHERAVQLGTRKETVKVK